MSVSSAIPDYVHESVRALPVLPTAVTRLLALARDVDADFREIARVIETDQALTARTLRAANSPLNGVSRQVKCFGVGGCLRVRVLWCWCSFFDRPPKTRKHCNTKALDV